MKTKAKKNLIIFSSLALLLVTAGIITTLILLRDPDKYQYPSERPLITNAEAVYFKVGNIKITREQVYYRALTNYGLGTFNDLVDSKLLPGFTDEAAYQEYRKKTIADYMGIDIDELTQEDIDEFTNEMKVQGYMTAQYVDDQLRLDYRRYLYTKAQLKYDVEHFEPKKNDDGEVIQEEYFTEAQYNAAKSNVFAEEAKVVIVTFRTQNEAVELLASLNIEIDNLRGWYRTVAGEKQYLTQAEVNELFVEIYNIVYEYRGSELKYNQVTGEIEIVKNTGGYIVLDQTLKTLSKTSSVIATKVFSVLDANKQVVNSYTTYPSSFNNGFYLALKYHSVKVSEEDQESRSAEVYDYLIENSINASTTSFYLFKMRREAGLVIYEEGLENNYAKSYDSALASEEDFEKFTKNTEVDNKNVAKFKVNGVETVITADQLCDELIARYGIQSVITFMNQYLIYAPAYSDVYDYALGVVRDTELYNEAQEDADAIIDALESGQYATNGFSKKYGWENYLRDYYGFLTYKELVLNGSAYDTAVKKFSKSTHTMENEAAVEIYNLFKVWFAMIDNEEYTPQEAQAKLQELNDLIEAKLQAVPETEKTIKYQIVQMYLDYYNVTAYTVGYFVDFDDDLKADDLSEYPELRLKGEELIEAIIARAKVDTVKGNGFHEKLNTVIKKEYNIAGINDPVWGDYKKAGLRLNLTDSSMYTDTNTEDEDLKSLLKKEWDRVRDCLDVESDGDKICFPTTSTISTANHALKYTFETDVPNISNDYYEMSYVYSRCVILSATNANWYTYTKTTSTTTKTLIPDNYLDLIKLYEINQKLESDKTSEEIEFEDNHVALQTYQKNWINAFYNQIITKFEGDDALSKNLAALRVTYLDNGTFQFTDPSLRPLYDEIMKILLEDK